MIANHSFRLLRSIALAALTGGAVNAPSHAASLIYEGFSGYAEGNMNGQARTGSGLAGNYEATGAGAINYNSSGLTFGSLAVSGGSITNNGGGGSAIGVRINASATGTLYTSYLVNFSTTLSTSTSTAIQTGLNTNPSTSNTTRYFNMMADSPAANTFNPGFGYNYSATGETTGNTLLANTTYMVIAEINNVGVALSGAQTGSGTMWVLNLQQFESFQLNGFTTVSLNAATVGTGISDVWARYTTATPLTSGTFAFSNAALQLSLTPTASNTATMDEVRWGTTLSDVAPVPEPGSLVIAAFGSILLAGRRSRR